MPIALGIFVIVAGVSFYGGMAYGQKHVGTSGAFTQGDGQARIGGQGFGGSGRRGGMNGQGGFVGGEVVSKDTQGITVKLVDGGSKIVIISPSTPVIKSVESSVADLMAGEQVLVTGKANGDGSVSAQSVQIRPASSTFPRQ